MLSQTNMIVLRNCRDRGGYDLREINEAIRHVLIYLGTTEPPLVQVDADQVTITQAGRDALAAS